MTTSKIKVYELAKELSQDSQHLVDVIQRLGIDIKNSMSVLGSEEVRTVREYYKKQRPLAKASVPPAPAKNPVTEKRVGATVIRRRSAKAAPEPPPLPTAEDNIETVVEETAMEAQQFEEAQAVEEVETQVE